MNDFTPPRWASPPSRPDELVALGGGPPVAHGPIAVLGAGTGLGQAFLLWSAAENRYQVVPSEGGHVDLAARTPLEHGLVQFLTGKYGRVSCERVLSGQGLVDVFAFLAEEPACRGLIQPDTAAALATPGPSNDPAAAISKRALAGHRSDLRDGAGAVLLRPGRRRRQPGPDGAGDRRRLRRGGHRAAHAALSCSRGGFREAFDRKGRLHTLVEHMPAYVVTHAQPGLLGAAIVAATDRA